MVLLVIFSAGAFVASSVGVPHGRSLSSGDDSDEDDDRCTGSYMNNIDDQCAAVKDNCGDVYFLINYLELFYCTNDASRIAIYLALTVWLTLLVSLLATTADYYFGEPRALRHRGVLSHAYLTTPIATLPYNFSSSTSSGASLFSNFEAVTGGRRDYTARVR